jgi:hypothetical protein
VGDDLLDEVGVYVVVKLAGLCLGVSALYIGSDTHREVGAGCYRGGR